MAVEVSLNVYSGKANPRWRLDAAQVRELRQLLASFEELKEGEIQPRLGYAGFTIQGESGSELRGPIEVLEGIVVRPEGSLLDRDRRLERWLLESAGQALSPALHDLVQRELET